MKLTRSILACVVVLFGSVAYGQEINPATPPEILAEGSQSPERRTKFLDKAFKFTADSTNAVYYRTVQETAEGFIVRDYFVSGKLHMEAPCSGYIPEPIIKGNRKRYFENGNLQDEGVLDGKDYVGIHKQYYENGNPKSEVDYDKKNPYFLHFFDITGRELLVNGNAVVLESISRDAGRDLWENYYDIKNHERFGCFSVASESRDTLYSMVEKIAEYKTGPNSLKRHVFRNLTLKRNPLGTHGTSYVRFVVDKNGTVRNVELLKGFYSWYDTQAVETVKKLKTWIPGSHRGKIVHSMYILPISF